MAKVCDITGRKAQAGRWTRHPHSGSWAHRAPQKARRFEVNLQTVTIQTPKGKKRIKVAARIVESTRRIVVQLSGSWPHLDHYFRIGQQAIDFSAADPQTG